MELLDKVRAELLRTGLIRPGEAVLLAVSGGADSVALTHLLRRLAGQLELTLFLAHFNHNLRGREAEEDALFVEGLGRDLGLAVFIGRGDVAGLARTRGRGLQEAGRKARYDFLEETAARESCSAIGLAHNLDDQAETVLLRLFGGAGLKGLSGMPQSRPVREGSPVRIIRPLLHITRAEIEAFLKSERLDFRIDSSNLKTEYRRNRLRLKTMPELQRGFNPALPRVLVRMAEQVREDSDYLEGLAAQVYQRAVSVESRPGLGLDLTVLRPEPLPIVRRVLARAYRAVTGDGIELESDHLEALARLIREGCPSGAVDLPGRVRAARDYDQLFFVEPEAGSESSPRMIRIRVHSLDPNRAPAADSLNTGGRPTVARLVLATGRVEGRLAIRTRRPGDWLRRADGSSKKLQDFYIEKKVSLRRRDEVLLLAADSRVLWIEGLYRDRSCEPEDREPGLEIVLEEVPFD